MIDCLAKSNHSRATGFTLIELIVSLVSATILMLALTLSLNVVARSIDVVKASHDEESVMLQRWVQDDLVSADQVTTVSASQIAIQRTSLDGSSESVQYRVNASGLERKISSDDWVLQDSRVTGLSLASLPYSITLEQNRTDAETPETTNMSASFTAPSVWGSTHFEDEDEVDQASVTMPKGGRSGDRFLLAVSASDSGDIDFPSGWATQADESYSYFDWGRFRSVTIKLKVATRAWSSSINNVNIQTDEDCPLCVVAIVLRNVDRSPIAAIELDEDQAWSSSRRPTAGLSSTTLVDELNLQVVATSTRAEHARSLGMPGYDNILCARSGDGNDVHSLYLAVRQGPLPALQTPSRGNLSWGASWILASMRIHP